MEASFTADNVYTLDRWKSADGSGGTPARTTTQETFSLGQTDVPNARYYLKHNQTGASTNGNAKLQQKVEDVTRFDGTTITFSFYAKADSPLTVDVRLIQNFGTGGSPSTSVTVTETGISIGTSWNKYTVTKTLGSLSGKTLGTDGEHTSYLDVIVDFKETSTFIFEATLFQLEKGLSATEFEHRPYTTEVQLCERYYRRTGEIRFLTMGRFNQSTGQVYDWWVLSPAMRAAPTATTDGNFRATSGYTGNLLVTLTDVKGIRLVSTNNASASQILYANEGELFIDAEL